MDIKDLINANNVRNHFNKMNFEEFHTLFHQDNSIEGKWMCVSEWKCTGFNNVDYLKYGRLED
jgi:hypothetical protein|tara:strand:+ start:7919 stop:8107 length:189 start_codon:yes stop_codon:yes gene_type:complete